MSHAEPLSAAAVELLERGPLYDNAIIAHGFTPWMRDYDLVVEALASAPGGQRSYTEGRYRYRFTHCVLAEAATELPAEAWHRSWDDVLTDYAAWERAGHPEGYVWGVNYMAAYPGARYVRGSPAAAEWAGRLGHSMHEVQVETNGHRLRLIFHMLQVHKVAQGSPDVDGLVPIEPVDLLAAAN